MTDLLATPRHDARPTCPTRHQMSASDDMPALVDGAERTELPPASEVSEEAFQRWRDELLDLSRRNPLVALGDHGVPLVAARELLAELEETVSAGPRIELRSADDLIEIDVPGSARSAADLSESTLTRLLARDLVLFGARDEQDLRKALTALRRRAEDIGGESGASPLYLTVGGLAAERGDGREDKDVAPIFLLPVTLETRPGQRASLQMEAAARVQVNECLAEWLRRDFGFEHPILTDPPETDTGLDVATILDELGDALTERGVPLTVVPDCRLALIDFSRLGMWRDLRDHADVLSGNALVAHLASPTSGAFADPVAEPIVDELDEARLVTPLPADGAQTKAVRWAREGRTFVLEGPPGTGKSQTIANIVADALADDRRVLFVAEKGAAVQAVQHRLRRLGLLPWCLDLHDREVTDRTVRGSLAVATKSAARAGETAQPLSDDLAERHRELLERLSELPAAIRDAAPDLPGEADLAVRRADAAEFAQVSAAVLAKRPEAIAHHRAVSLDAAVREGTHGLGELTQERRERTLVGVGDLLAAHIDAVLAVTPCVIASPSSVAALLPAQADLFDLVVFDEASQVRVADVIGAAGRGRAVVIAGDSRQMPPSDLFAGGRGQAADRAVDQHGDQDAEEEGESILVEAVRRGVPRLELTWHYRSRVEGLISFSNERYYDRRLASFPSPPGSHLDGGIEFRRADGTYETQGKRVNVVEADAVIREVDRLLAEDHDASIGVVTFNADQRDLILDRLEAYDPNTPVRVALRRLEAPLIVKTLEHIQGDERDHILFSLTYSAGADGRLPANFGRLSSAGGERRLNVAITRARLRNVLFCSFEPEDIDRSSAVGVGPAHLRDYLKAARARGLGGRDGAPSPDEGAAPIAEALRSRGIEVRTSVGKSSFRVDLAVRRPDGEWVAFQLDTPSWAARTTVSDRDVLPDAVLSGLMGWAACHQLYRTEWAADPKSVLARILALTGHDATADTPTDGRVGNTSDAATDDGAGSASDAATGDAIDAATADDGVTAGDTTSPAAEDAAAGETDAATDEAAGTIDNATSVPAPAHTPRGGEASTVATPAWIEDEDADERVRYGAGPGEYVVARPLAAADDAAQFPHHYLTDMHTARRRAVVSAQWRGVVGAEGPILRERAAAVVAHRFDTSVPRRGAKKRAFWDSLPEDFTRTISPDGVYLWPAGARPEDYRLVRTSSRPVRQIGEIAPEERRNALVFALAQRGGAADLHALLGDTAQLFGFGRVGRVIDATLRRTVDELAAARVIEVAASSVRLPGSASTAAEEAPSRP